MNEFEYDVIMSNGAGFGLHVCSECNGTKEITGHKYWCSKVKNKLQGMESEEE